MGKVGIQVIGWSNFCHTGTYSQTVCHTHLLFERNTILIGSHDAMSYSLIDYGCTNKSFEAFIDSLPVPVGVTKQILPSAHCRKVRFRHLTVFGPRVRLTGTLLDHTVTKHVIVFYALAISEFCTRESRVIRNYFYTVLYSSVMEMHSHLFGVLSAKY